MAEKDSLDSAFKHATRLLEQGDLCDGVKHECTVICVRVKCDVKIVVTLCG